MSAIPVPKDLPEAARSTQRIIEDHEWKRYQRYLRKIMQQRTNTQKMQPLLFEEFCDEQQNQETSNKTT